MLIYVDSFDDCSKKSIFATAGFYELRLRLVPYVCLGLLDLDLLATTAAAS
jgi:hypothetical protein